MVLGDGVVAPGLVMSAVRRYRGYQPFDLVEQRVELGGIVNILAGQCRGDDRAGLGIDAQM
jgi:hypothetical protein